MRHSSPGITTVEIARAHRRLRFWPLRRAGTSVDAALEDLRERGEADAPLDELYGYLTRPDLLLLGYARVAANEGSMTAGIDDETADGMSLARIEELAESLRSGRYRWSPVRRIHVAKKGKETTRPLGLPAWTDRLVQEAMRLLLDAYYEPRFSDHSHGFRVGRGCGTAIRAIGQTWRGVHWLIEGDIASCFDSLDHEVLLGILGERITDRRFLALLSDSLEAGYLDGGAWLPSPLGVPQGGILSPLLANIYLDRLDRFVASELFEGRMTGPGATLAGRLAGWWKHASPSPTTCHYVRYADDFLLGLDGSERQAQLVKRRLAAFLHDELRLTLSEEKTLITDATSGAARFLGYDVRRSDDGEDRVALRLPAAIVSERSARYCQDGKPVVRRDLLGEHPADIVARYSGEYASFLAYYERAENPEQAENLRRVMELSLARTLAERLGISVSEVYRRYHRTVGTPDGPRAVLRYTERRLGRNRRVAEFGRVRPGDRSCLEGGDGSSDPRNDRTDLSDRLATSTCELCGSEAAVEVHQVRSTRKLGRKRTRWAALMRDRRRKTLVVCPACHAEMHGRLAPTVERSGGQGGLRRGLSRFRRAPGIRWRPGRRAAEP